MKKIIILVIIIIVLALAAVAYWKYLNPRWAEPPITGPADDRFGFLTGPDPNEYQEARETGAGWIRPHPGPFVWRDMQKDASSPIEFKETDELINDAAKADVKVLVTLWPYAEWDQKARPDANNCIVSRNEFQNEFGKYRCNPYHWKEYLGWVSSVVERYDGDGLGDMPGLQNPVTHWEVFNEPDLQQMPGEEGLQFYVGEPSDYAELLQRTSGAIKTVDPNAKVLIAGAASGGNHLDFWQDVFSEANINDHFDIANIHCISSDDIASFNVEPYSKLLTQYGLNKPIWVTEAEVFVSNDLVIIATQLKLSTQEAFSLGAEKIFYTSSNLKNRPGNGKPPEFDAKITPDPSLDLGNSKDIYQTIFNSI